MKEEPMSLEKDRPPVQAARLRAAAKQERQETEDPDMDQAVKDQKETIAAWMDDAAKRIRGRTARRSSKGLE